MRVALVVTGHFLLHFVILFGPAGNIGWTRGWILIALNFTFALTATTWLARHDPDLLKERMKFPIQRHQPRWDQTLIAVFLTATVAWYVFLPIDALHLHILPPPPGYLSLLGLFACAGGQALVFQTMRVNTFLAPVVKLQAERKHRVIDSGPYAVVRHPMYAAVLPLFGGAALWLQSTLGAILALLPTGILVARILREEKFLQDNLLGYRDYQARVRWRLLPFIW